MTYSLYLPSETTNYSRDWYIASLSITMEPGIVNTLLGIRVREDREDEVYRDHATPRISVSLRTQASLLTRRPMREGHWHVDDVRSVEIVLSTETGVPESMHLNRADFAALSIQLGTTLRGSERFGSNQLQTISVYGDRWPYPTPGGQP